MFSGFYHVSQSVMGCLFQSSYISYMQCWLQFSRTVSSLYSVNSDTVWTVFIRAGSKSSVLWLLRSTVGSVLLFWLPHKLQCPLCWGSCGVCAQFWLLQTTAGQYLTCCALSLCVFCRVHSCVIAFCLLRCPPGPQLLVQCATYCTLRGKVHAHARCVFICSCFLL